MKQTCYYFVFIFEVLCWTPVEVSDFEMVYQAKSKAIKTCKSVGREIID